MQFIANGPDIPNGLLQAHEDGRVVFFCGSGISDPAGLPGFKGLVDKIYNCVGSHFAPPEQEAYDRDQYDVTLDLLERRLPGNNAMRTALAKSLVPNLRRKGATNTHSALLTLSRCRGREMRLVTTNFDRIFERVIKRDELKVKTYAAPTLPIPKNSRWNGLVYLHGLLPENSDMETLNHLVLTSGDFGLAYLVERWAARFVSELFQNYVVCFVGYSIGDPILRYMMDALAADRRQGEITPQAYALGGSIPGEEELIKSTHQWEAKGVTPILYDKSNKHAVLHETLKAWASAYRDGVYDKEHVVGQYAITRPSASTEQDDYVGRMLWALSDKSGLPAKRFAEFNPAPPLEWLEAFSKVCYRQGDLSRFGVPAHAKIDNKLEFTLIARPTPYDLAPWMTLIHGDMIGSEWDAVMKNIAYWLIRHLDDPTLILWLAQRGNQLHERLSHLIERELDRFAEMEREGQQAELDDIRKNAPNAIPGPQMRIFWRLFLTGRMKSLQDDGAIYLWRNCLKQDGLTTTRRLQLRELLAPKVTLKKRLRWYDSENENDRGKVDWEIKLASNNVRSALLDLRAPYFTDILPHVLDDFQQLLRDALDLFRELDKTDDHCYLSLIGLPSISPHRQNRGFYDWVTLIELLRDAWLAKRKNAPERTTQIAQNWFTLPYATFKRLALFAASQEGCIPARQWVDWLTADDALWLWHPMTHRETMRLLVLQGNALSEKDKKRLETAILAGPPPESDSDDMGRDIRQSRIDRSIWLRLVKLQEGCGALGKVATQRFNALSKSNPKWRLADPPERNEFLHWISVTGDPDHENYYKRETPPRKHEDLVAWLKQEPNSDFIYTDTWNKSCRTRCFHSLCALHELTQEDLWPTDRWATALYVWSNGKRVLQSRRFLESIESLVHKMPEAILLKLAPDVAWWLNAVSQSNHQNETRLLNLCERIMELPYQPSTTNNQSHVFDAINHPVGLVTQIMLNILFERKPNDGDILPDDIKPFFTRLCDTTQEQFRHGRVVLASELIALFRVDRPWTEAHLLPLFNWTTSLVEASAAWQGFLRSPRLHWPLLIAFKTQFLDSAHHYAELNEAAQQFATFLTYAALDCTDIDGYTATDFQTSFDVLPPDGLEASARSLWRALDSAGEQREEYWENRIYPFWQNIWPKSRDRITLNISESLALLSIAAGNAFPSALAEVKDWLQPLQNPYHPVGKLQESGLAERFPEEALNLLDAIIGDQPFAGSDLRSCLDVITKASPTLLKNHRYQRLSRGTNL